MGPPSRSMAPARRLCFLAVVSVMVWPARAPPPKPCPDVNLGPHPQNISWSNWPAFAHFLAEEVAEADQPGQGFDLVWYGDSITEAMRGTCIGEDWARVATGSPEVYSQFFGQYHSGILAVCGDTLGNLWSRLLNGGVPKVNAPKVVVTLIGTNDLTAAYCNSDEHDLMDAAANTGARYPDVIGLLRQAMPSSHIVMQAITPRASNLFAKPLPYTWPNRMTAPINFLNAQIERYASTDDHLHYINCGEVLLLPSSLNPNYLKDGIHISAEGLEKYLACLQPLILDLLSWSASSDPSSGWDPHGKDQSHGRDGEPDPHDKGKDKKPHDHGKDEKGPHADMDKAQKDSMQKKSS